MIYFKPCVSLENSAEISFEAIENDASCGKCNMTITEKGAIVDYIAYDEDKSYLVEGLLKSAFNYAVTKNAYMGYCKCENITHFLECMNFEKANGVYYNDIPSILQGNCCKKP